MRYKSAINYIKLLFSGRKGINLKTQLIISFILISISVLVTGSVLTYKSIQTILQEYSEESTVQYFRQAENNIGALIDETEKLSRTIMMDTRVESILEGGHDSVLDSILASREISQLITGILNSYDHIDSIFIICEDLHIYGASRKGNWNMFTPNESFWFYASELYFSAKQAFPYAIWTGKLQSRIFEPDLAADTDYQNRELITAVRGIRSINQGKQSATLLINIKKEKLRSIYNSFPDSASKVYILDSDGDIISAGHNQPTRQENVILNNMIQMSDYGSYINKENSTQVIYYRLKRIGWLLVKEIPIMEFSLSISRLRTIIVISFVLSLIFIIGLYTFWINKITKPLKQLTCAMKEVSNGLFGETVEVIPKNEIGLLIDSFNRMSLSIPRLIKQNKAIEEEKRSLEMEALQAQINPHFLYNTLNMIKWMAAMVNSKNITESLIALGNILNPLFKSQGRFCTVQEEIEYIKNYIKIMSFRFGSGMKFVIRVPEELMQQRVLRFILQPVIENAVTHGMTGVRHIGSITIEALDKGPLLLFEVSDTGVGMTPEKIKALTESLECPVEYDMGSGSSIGLFNVNRRIKLSFGMEYGVAVESALGIGTKVKLTLPKTIFK